MRRTNDRGIGLIKSFEGLRLQSYQCAAGVWTIAYGHTGRDIVANMTCTEEEAEAWLRQDLLASEAAVSRLVKVPISDNAFAALVSLVFNIGAGGFASSTVLRKTNEGKFPAAAKAFLLWNKVKGKVNMGLCRRRKIEAELFLEV